MRTRSETSRRRPGSWRRHKGGSASPGGCHSNGETEEQIRAEAAAESRALVDLFMEVVKTEVKDEDLRDRIARAILERVPTALDDDE